MKNNDPGPLRNQRFLPVVTRPRRDAVVFETWTPSRRPVGQLALAVQMIRQISLFVAELLSNLVCLGFEVFEHIGVCAQIEPKNRRIAGDAPGALVIMNDQKFTRMIKKRRQVTCDHHIQVQKQGNPLPII